MGTELLIQILSCDFVLQHAAFRFLRDRVLMLRSVNSKLKQALHEETGVSLNIRVNQSVLKLNQDFLFSWKGTLFIYMKCESSDSHCWLQSLAAALAFENKPRIGLLDLDVEGQTLPTVVDLLAVALADKKAVHRAVLRYVGSCRPIAAARLAALQAVVPTEVIANIMANSAADAIDGLSALHGSGVAVSTLVLRQGTLLPLSTSLRHTGENAVT
jgi:hypothetical protein